jgi:hypothetical protein
MPPSVARPPTHIMRIEVPLCLEPDAHRDYDPLRDALRVCLAATRAAYDDIICHDVTVTVTHA